MLHLENGVIGLFVLFPIRLADLEKQLEQLLQQVTTLRGDIASSRPMLTKGCCKGNNYEQRFALDTFPADFSWRNVLAKPCILLFTLQQDCYTRIACRLLLVVKVVRVVFPCIHVRRQETCRRRSVVFCCFPTSSS